jgi:hypothetical protein
MNNETIQPLEGFAAYFGIDPDDVVSESGTFKRDSEGIYELVSAEIDVNDGFGFYTFEVDAEAIERHAPDHLARVEALMAERDPLRCTECRKLGPDCDCDGA